MRAPFCFPDDRKRSIFDNLRNVTEDGFQGLVKPLVVEIIAGVLLRSLGPAFQGLIKPLVVETPCIGHRSRP